MSDWTEVNLTWDGDTVDGEWVEGFSEQAAPGMLLTVRYLDGEEDEVLIGDINDRGGTCRCCDYFCGDEYGAVILRYRWVIDPRV